MWVDSPPCLQRVWCTVREDKLIMHTTWRSRDIYRAMHMNMLALTELQSARERSAKLFPRPIAISWGSSVHRPLALTIPFGLIILHTKIRRRETKTKKGWGSEDG
nr:hypothetical protein [Candidatus Njordarchaeum guaymaensis]